MTSTQYQMMASMMSNETLRHYADKTGSLAYYAKAELSKRDRVVTFS
jgi:hypothetical protein